MKVICNKRNLRCAVEYQCNHATPHDPLGVHSCGPCSVEKDAKCVSLEDETMSLDEAIKHAEEKAITHENFFQCALEHYQLAEWLKELKAFRDGN